jgi:molybdate transport system substrate-binding protein
MTPVVTEIAKMYEEKTGQAVEINSAGSGELLAHIDLHKRGDVYVSHDPFLDILMQKFGQGVDGYLLAELTPVIAVRKGNPKNIKGLKDLTRDDVELILTDYKGSSLGRMLGTIFGKAGIDFDKLNETKKIHTNRSGGYAANFVMTDNADATMVWDAVAHLRADKLDVVRIDGHLPVPHVDAVTSATGVTYKLTPMRVTAATLRCSQNAGAAAKFLEYLASEEANKVFGEFGFTTHGSAKLYEDGKAIEGAPHKEATRASTQGSGRVKVYAGAGLRAGIDELIDAFKDQSGIVVEPDYGGSGIILTRAQLNKDGDLFMPGDVSWVQILQDKTGEVETMTSISYFVPVIVVAKGNPKNIKSVEDFYRDDVAVGLGRAKACQVGKVSSKILKNYGLDRSKLVHKESLTVNEIGVWVKMKDIDAGIAWDAIAANMSDSLDMIAIPMEKNIISNVVVGLLRDAKNKAGAQAFIDFMKSDKGQKILNDNGFQTKEPK